jgi:hypothetical protein
MFSAWGWPHQYLRDVYAKPAYFTSLPPALLTRRVSVPIRAALALPCRLMVRQRTLTPFIEVRILAGHPVCIQPQQNWDDSGAKPEKGVH